MAKSADFAQPILHQLRQVVHDACPEVEETIKWGFPHFEYKGILCSMAAFKQHCAFGFWKASLMSDPNRLLSTVGKTAMGHFGQIKSVADLPSDPILKRYIKEAVKLNHEEAKLPKRAKPSALSKNKKALKAFESFSYSNKKEYVEWVTEAKTEETREKRLATSVDWMAEGKVRNWKYVKR